MEDSSPVMQVTKRDGSREPVDIKKITAAIQRHSIGLEPFVDVARVAQKTIDGLFDGCSTQELDRLAIQTSAFLSGEEPEYSRLSARMLATFIHKEVEGQSIHSFSQSIEVGYATGLISDKTAAFVAANKRKLNNAIDDAKDDLFEYIGINILYSRYFLKHPTLRTVIETPQIFFMRVACGLAETAQEAIDLYRLLSSFEFMFSTPTLFNSGTKRPQLSSCFLLDTEDSLNGIYGMISDIARLEKYAGGCGVSVSKIRAAGSKIAGTNGISGGMIPFLKVLDSSVLAVDQGSNRPGACAVYLEPWHSDIESYLTLRTNTGDINRRTFNLNLAIWVNDLYMCRVRNDEMWSLFSPSDVPQLTETYGDEFKRIYEAAEQKGLYTKQIKARDLYMQMMRGLLETGQFWMTFKDRSNERSNQTGLPGNVIHSLNLCTETCMVTNDEEVSVCNLGSINLAKYLVSSGGEVSIDWEHLAKNVQTAIKYLNHVIDVNLYAIPQTEKSNTKWRPVGLGLMSWQDVLFSMKLPFDSQEALELAVKVQREIYYNALVASNNLAIEFGSHPSFGETRFGRGEGFEFERSGLTVEEVDPEDIARWETLRRNIQQYGLRNSLLLAVAPTATIASITGVFESIEPAARMLFRREVLGGDYLQVCSSLVHTLRDMGLWDQKMRDRIKSENGAIQGIDEIPIEVRNIYKTAWDLSMKPLIDQARERQRFIDQAQSLNLFIDAEKVDIGRAASMYAYAWGGPEDENGDIDPRRNGLKSTYYLRTRAATRVTSSVMVEEIDSLVCVLAPIDGSVCEVCQ